MRCGPIPPPLPPNRFQAKQQKDRDEKLISKIDELISVAKEILKTLRKNNGSFGPM